MRQEVREPLKARMAEADHGLEHVQTDVRTCGILVDDPTAPGTFRFGHKSFMEYLFAAVVSEAIAEPEEPDSPAILDACDASAADIAHLSVSLKFLSQLLGASMGGSAIGDQKKMAARILRLLFGRSSWAYTLGRLHLYDRTVRRLRMSKPLLYRIVVPVPVAGVVGLAVVTVGLVAVGLVAVAGTWMQGSNGDEALLANDLLAWARLMAVATAAILGATTIMLNMGRTRNVRMRLYVWERVCQELGIADEILFSVAGVGWLPRSRGRAFELFPEGGFELWDYEIGELEDGALVVGELSAAVRHLIVATGGRRARLEVWPERQSGIGPGSDGEGGSKDRRQDGS